MPHPSSSAADRADLDRRLADLLERAAERGPAPRSRLDAVLAGTTTPAGLRRPERPGRHRGRRVLALAAAAAGIVAGSVWSGSGQLSTAVPAAVSRLGLDPTGEVVLHRVELTPWEVEDRDTTYLITLADLDVVTTVQLDSWARPLVIGHPTAGALEVLNRTFPASHPGATDAWGTDPAAVWCALASGSPTAECGSGSGDAAEMTSHSLASLWLGVPDDAAVVTATAPDGETRWQRPVDGVVAFSRTRSWNPDTLCARLGTDGGRGGRLDVYDADGALLAAVEPCLGTWLAPPDAG